MAEKQATKLPTMENRVQEDEEDRITASITLPARQLSFVALLFSFTLIWILVLSGLLLKGSFTKEDDIVDTVRTFNAHQDLGRVVFALGHEMGMYNYL